MRSRTFLIIAALAAVAVFAGLAAIAGADAQPANVIAASATDSGVGDVALDKLAAGGRSPGVYAARDWRTIDPSVYPVVGGHDSFSWEELEPNEGSYNWSRLDSFIADQAALGKKSAIGITTYNGRIEGGIVVPAWLRTNYPQTVITCSGGWLIPKYWNNTYLTKYGNFVAALANHLGTNANISFVQIGVGLYGETQPADDSDDTCVKNAMNAEFGFTVDFERSAKWVETAKLIIDKWGAAFGNNLPLFLVYTPSFLDVCEKQKLTEYAAGKYGIGLFAGGTYADTLTVFSATPGGAGCQKWDPIVNWNSSPTATIPVAMESYGYMLPDPTQFYWGMLGALNKHPDYLNLESDLFFSDENAGIPIYPNLDVMRFANSYLGKTPATAPNAWVAMRETSPATNNLGCNKNTFFPQYGDYDYYLSRDDTVTGGKTITVSSIATFAIGNAACGTVGQVVSHSAYDSRLAGKGREGWMTRRTDNASGNDYMYFKVDDAFVSGQGLTATVLITVTYFDYGLDTWQLQWKNASGTDRSVGVLKTNTNQWKTQTFTVSDISFSNQYANGNDFRIYNGAVGDEYIHMVMIGKPGPSGPTPTATRTGTRTATPTATPITVVFQQELLPDPSYTGTDDTFISNYGDTTTNFGTNGMLYLRSHEGADVRDALIKFDLSSIPSNAVIQSATLSFYVDHQTNPMVLPITMHKVRRNWIDTEATWLNATSATAWGTAGARNTTNDIFAAVVASATLTTVDVWQDFNVTGLVGEWIQGGNYGVLIRAGVAAGNVEYHLRSADYAAHNEFRPKLSVTYRLPPGPTPTFTRTLTPSRTPTRTLTPTITLTPTPTPVIVTFQKGVSPSGAYAGVQDTFISTYGGDDDVNYGISPTLSLRDSDRKVALLRFDVSGITPTVNILSATLSVHAYAATNANVLNVGAYRVMRTWTETGATWNHATAAISWAVPGANGIGSDRDDVATDSLTMHNTGVWYDFDVTGLARLWVQQPAQNFGVVLKTEAGDQVELSLLSSDYTAAPVVRPKLTIIYTTFYTGPTPTPTRTRTFTPSPTPTRTATAAPDTVIFQRGREPIPGFAGVYDTYISNFGDTSLNYGISPTLKLRSDDVEAALLRFDISSLPPTTNIINATLSVHVDYKTNAFTLPVNLYKVLRTWNELDATWLKATGSVLWGVPGANAASDRLTTPSAGVTMSSADEWYDFDVTNLAKQWFANPADNKGVILKAGSGPNVEYGLRSSEYFSAPGFRPKLTIQCYNCQVQAGHRISLPVILSSFTNLQ